MTSECQADSRAPRYHCHNGRFVDFRIKTEDTFLIIGKKYSITFHEKFPSWGKENKVMVNIKAEIKLRNNLE